MKSPYLSLVALMAAAVSLPAAAHHSYAMFDIGKTMTVEGTVSQFQWTNPHSWLFLKVPDTAGQIQEWPIEFGAPAGLARQGWTRSSITVGMKVKVALHPLKDGKPGGQYVSVTLPDGTQYGGKAQSLDAPR